MVYLKIWSPIWKKTVFKKKYSYTGWYRGTGFIYHVKFVIFLVVIWLLTLRVLQKLIKDYLFTVWFIMGPPYARLSLDPVAFIQDSSFVL